MFKNAIFALLFFLLVNIAAVKHTIAQELIFGIEPFPPIFTENGQGLGADLLKKIQKNSDLNFQIRIMTYARAKKELKNDRIDAIGLIPKGLETKEFYQYALELDWYFNNHVDIYSLEQKYLNIDAIPTKSLGTLIGNADFFAAVLNIPRKKFFEVSSLDQLIKMLEKKRLNAIVFERVSTMSSIQKIKQKNVYYRFLKDIPATFAVPNTEQGKELKLLLDSHIKQHTTADTFQRDPRYHNLPIQGKVPQIQH